ncbi:MAG: sulfatase-like hydrolase/transferase [Planctomycetes bacterium]|nr:sulfatase-like hydrolase/transferase [Planctomycetota bacterium]
MPTGGGTVNRPAPKAKNNFIVITLDSCRYDSFMAAEPKNIPRLSGGKIQKRYSYASWTGPSHYNLLMGLLPHVSPQNEFASEYYKEDFLNYNQRFGMEGMEFAKLVPAMWMPEYLRNELGYTTHARVSLPVLNSRTGVNRGFDTFQLMDKHNDMKAMLPTLKFDNERPSFTLMNVGETHYPFVTPDQDPKDWPRISGIHGVFKHLDSQTVGGKLVKDENVPKFFDQEKLDTLRGMQINTVKYLDEEVFPALYDMVPDNTWIVVTADHGELFGESGYFGHGPIMHEKVFEVPYLEGKIR